MKVSINGVKIAFDETGSGPALLLIHGFPLNRRMWQPQSNALSAAGYRVITPDLRGFGDSDAPEGPYSISLFADDIIALLDHLGLEQAVIGGMSMGGYVLLELAERVPQRMKGACFIVTRSGADDEAGKAKRLALAAEVRKSGPRITADAFANLLFAGGGRGKKRELAEEVYGWMSATDARGLAGALLAMRERKDYTPFLGEMTMPALVIGAKQDLAIPPEHSEKLAQGLPDSRLRIIDGGGHLVNLEQPEAFNRCMLEFLKEVYTP